MKSKSKASNVTIPCPICKAICKTRGLHAHLRLAHPEVDPMKYLRKSVINPLNKGERIIFQVAEMETGQWRIKHVGLDEDDKRILCELMNCLQTDGNFNAHPLYHGID